MWRSNGVPFEGTSGCSGRTPHNQLGHHRRPEQATLYVTCEPESLVDDKHSLPGSDIRIVSRPVECAPPTSGDGTGPAMARGRSRRSVLLERRDIAPDHPVGRQFLRPVTAVETPGTTIVRHHVRIPTAHRSGDPTRGSSQEPRRHRAAAVGGGDQEPLQLAVAAEAGGRCPAM